VKRRFVLVTDPLTADQERRIAAAMQHPIEWWHHIPNMWLVVDTGDRVTTGTLRTLMNDVAPGAKMFATEVDPGAWWSARFNSVAPAQRRWLEEHWEGE
jgi:hypothetical protein